MFSSAITGHLNGAFFMEYLEIRNWRNFQHYKDRNPPWIKLHYSLLTSHDWVMLSDASKLLAVVCMMIASQKEGKIPYDEEYIRRVAQLSNRPDLKPLIDCGFFCDASTMLANASTKKRREEKRREDIYSEAKASSYTPIPPKAKTEPESFKAFWQAWPQKENKQPALKAFLKLEKEIPHDSITRIVQLYAEHCRTTGRPYCHAATWLNQRRWANDYQQLINEARAKPASNPRPYPAQGSNSFTAEAERIKTRILANASDNPSATSTHATPAIANLKH